MSHIARKDSDDEEAILLEVLDTAIAITDADFGNIQLLDAETGELRIVAQRGFPTWWLDYWETVSHGHGACGTAIVRGERVIVGDVEEDPIFVGTPALDIQRRAGVRAVQSTPLISRMGRYLGMFSTHYRMPYRPDARTERLLDLLARHAAEGIERARAERARYKSDARFRAFFDNAAVGAAQIDRAGRFTDVNDRYCDLTGYSRDELTGGMTPLDLDHPEDVEDDKVHITSFLDGQSSSYDREKRYIRKDGRVIWVRVQVAAVRDERGVLEATAAIIEDITDRREAESALRQFKTLAETSTQFIGLCGPDLVPTFINAAGLRLVGLESLDPARAVTVPEFFHPDDRDHFRATFLTKLTEGGHATGEIRLRHFKTGAGIPVLHTATALKNDRGEITSYATVTLDLTEIKRSERAVLQQERKYRAFVAAVSDVLFRMSPDWTTLYVLKGNGLVADIDEPTTRWLDTYIPKDNQAAVVRAGRRAIATKSAFELKHRLLSADGSAFWVESRIAPFLDDSGEIAEWIGTAKNVSELLEAQEHLRESEERLRLSLAAGHMAIWDWHMKADTVIWNEQHFRMLGYEPNTITPSYKVWRDRVVPADLPSVEAAIRKSLETGCEYTAQFRILGKNDAVRWVEAHGRVEPYPDHRPRRFYGVMSDISERKLAEEQMALLLKEVNHRAKNLLAVVQAIAQQTAENETPAKFYASFSDRLRGLSASQDLLVDAQWQGVAIATLVRSQLAYLAPLTGRRIMSNGPECLLRPSAAQAIGMALHELATNAVKYGALSNATGVVDLSWSLTPGGPGLRFVMRWTEQDGPPVHPPSRVGFGHTVTVEMPEHLLGARATLSFERSGVVWTLDAPADKIFSTATPSNGEI